MAVKKVGRFEMDTETGSIAGPAEYMEERGSAKLRAIEAGTDTVFNAGLTRSPDIYTAILVSLQTDFAGWLGQRQLEAAMGRAG